MLEVRKVVLTLCNSPHMSGPGLLHASVGTPLQEYHGEGLRDIPAQLASHPAQGLCQQALDRGPPPHLQDLPHEAAGGGADH